MNYLILAIILVIIFLFLINNNNNNDKNNIEGYNEETGQFCTTCSNKTINQCLQCFNCGWCVDKWGNSACIGGDHKGPYNYERCYKWKHGDPFSEMLNRNKNYKCSYGPKQANRVIGINPC